MYHKEKVRAFLGPYCASEFEAVAKMCSFWNIPAISYMPRSTAVSDRNIYKTLARLSSKNTNSIAKAVIRMVEHYGWRKVKWSFFGENRFQKEGTRSSNRDENF